MHNKLRKTKQKATISPLEKEQTPGHSLLNIQVTAVPRLQCHNVLWQKGEEARGLACGSTVGCLTVKAYAYVLFDLQISCFRLILASGCISHSFIQLPVFLIDFV